MATSNSLSASGHFDHASSVNAHVQSSSYQSKNNADLHSNAKSWEPQTSDLLMRPEDDGNDVEEDDEDDEDYIPPEDEDEDHMDIEIDYSVHEGDFYLGKDEEDEDEEGGDEEGEDEEGGDEEGGDEEGGDEEGEDEEGEDEEGEDEEDDDEEDDDDEDEEGEDEDEAENAGVELEGSNEKVESKHEDNASVYASLRNDIEVANSNSARPSPVPPKPGHSNAPTAKAKGSTPSPSPPICTPSQSQPFPLPSYDPMTPLDPSIDLSSKPPKTEVESSPEPDFSPLSQMLAKMRPQASQHAKSTVDKGRGQGSARVSAVSSQDIASNVSKSPMAVHNAVSSTSLPATQPPRPRPVARKVKPQVRPTELRKSSTLSATPENEDGDKNKNNGKGKRRASIESFRSCEEDISKESLRPTKRSKLDLPAPVAHKHERFWILDGNTILEVGGVLFKLHRSRLVDQSTFFAGLLNDQDVLMDDSVVVESDEHSTVYHLSNTTPTDLEALLQLDKDPMAYYFVPPAFQVLAAILRAATALGFNTYRAFAVKLLENAWSSSLADLTAESKSNAVEVVVLARTCGIESVLKRAFYEMVRVSGYGLGDGELDGGDGEGSQEISRADERRLERMREHLISSWSQAAVRVDRLFTCPNQPKETPSTSSTSARLPGCPPLSLKQDAWERRVHDSGLYDEYQFDPLCGLQALIDIKWDEEEGWCSDCVRVRREAWTRMRQKTWERIGVWMGLDN